MIDSPKPFIVPVTHTADGSRGPRSAAEPLQTITRAKGGELAVAAPTILPVTHAGSDDRVYDPADPLRTVTAANRGEIGLTSAMLVPRYGERDGQEPRVRDVADPYPVVVPTGNGGDLGTVLLSGASVGVGGRAGQSPPRGLDDPLHTVTAKADRAATVAFLQKMNQNGIGTAMEDPLVTAMAQAPRHYEVAAHLGRQFGTGLGRDLGDPAPTVMPDGGGKTQLVAASMIQHNGDRVGREMAEPVTALTHRSTQQQVLAAAIDKYYGSGVAADVAEPLDTATDKARFGLVGAFLEQANTGVVGHSAEAPVSTILAAGCHQRLIEVGMVPANDHDGSTTRSQVIDFLWKHFGEPTDGEWADPTGTPGARLKFGLVILAGTVWQITDVGMRMLTPRELFNAQGFPPTYIIDRTANDEPVTKTAQTSMAGNSVSPPPAEASLRANLTWMDLPEKLAA